MAALVNKTKLDGGADGGTTTGIDTTGANLIVICIACHVAGSGLAPSDNKGNTYTEAKRSSITNSPMSHQWYCLSPTVGTGHTFTFAYTSTFPAMHVLAYSGAAASNVLDQTGTSSFDSGANDVTSLAAGTVTPTADNEIVIQHIAISQITSAHTITNSFTVEEESSGSNGLFYGGCAGEKFLGAGTSGNAVNATFNWTTGVQNVRSTTTTWKTAAAGSSFIAPPPLIAKQAVNRASRY